MSAEIRQGDSWSYSGKASVVDPDGSSISLAGWSVKSQLFTHKGELVDEFEVGWINEDDGLFFHKADASKTAKWPEGGLVFNIKFTSPTGESESTDPVYIAVTKAMTK